MNNLDDIQPIKVVECNSSIPRRSNDPVLDAHYRIRYDQSRLEWLKGKSSNPDTPKISNPEVIESGCGLPFYYLTHRRPSVRYHNN